MAREAPNRAPGTAPIDESDGDPPVDVAEQGVGDRPRDGERPHADERRGDGALDLHPRELDEGRHHDHAAADAEQAGEAARHDADGGVASHGRLALGGSDGGLGCVGLGPRLLGRQRRRRPPHPVRRQAEQPGGGELQQVAVARHPLRGHAPDHCGAEPDRHRAGHGGPADEPLVRRSGPTRWRPPG